MGCLNAPKDSQNTQIIIGNSKKNLTISNKIENKENKENKEKKENMPNKEIIGSKDIIIELEEEKNEQKINFKDLFMDSLSPEFINLFKTNTKLFYSKTFYEGICKEYGLFGETQNKDEALQIYKNGADEKNDYLCMYRLHRIYVNEYNEFKLERDANFEKLYLYKCFAYLPYSIINGNYFIFNKINFTYYVLNYLEKKKDENLHNFEKFLNYLSENNTNYNLSQNDIKLMKLVLKSYINSLDHKNIIDNINSLLYLEKGDSAYYEAQLKYCNFYLDYFKHNYDKNQVNNIFDNLIKCNYYKACYDFANFLIQEGDYDKAKNILKFGMDNSQQYCFSVYYYLYLKETEIDNLLMNYRLFSSLLNNMILIMCIEKLNYSSIFYMIFYLFKHSSYKNDLERNYTNLLQEIYKNIESNLNNINNIKHIYADRYIQEIIFIFGQMCYYGIFNKKKQDKEKALSYFKQSYNMSKENEYLYLKRINYLYIYKCRKYLFKKNKINEQKYEKTKRKLIKIYLSNIEYINPFELYNLYKIKMNDNIRNDKGNLIKFLRKGKNYKMIYNFRDYVYLNKCKRILKEYENYCTVCYENKDNLIKLEPCKDLICEPCFKNIEKDNCPTCGKALENSE